MFEFVILFELMRRKQTQKISPPSNNHHQEDELVNAARPKKQLHITKQKPTAKAILDKIAREFKAYDDCRFEFRESEIQEI